MTKLFFIVPDAYYTTLVMTGMLFDGSTILGPEDETSSIGDIILDEALGTGVAILMS